MDKDKVQAGVDERATNPYRVKEGTFQLPKDASVLVKQSITRQALTAFITTMGKQGWQLASKDVRVGGPFRANDLALGVPLLDTEEFRVRAVFRYKGPTPQPLRVEVPGESIRQAPDQTQDLTKQDELRKALA